MRQLNPNGTFYVYDAIHDAGAAVRGFTPIG